jgi:hypothetical protein
MRRIAFPFAAALLTARFAAAQPEPMYPPPPGAPVSMTMERERLKALRLQLGISGVSNGYYCAYGYVLYGCSNVSYGTAPLTFGGEFELGGRAFGLALGVYDMVAPYGNLNKNFVEPMLDLVIRAGTYNGGPILRIRFGTGVYFGESGNVGWVGRGGLGLTLRGRGPWGFAMEAVWEGGTFSGRAVSVVRGTIGPEFAF